MRQHSGRVRLVRLEAGRRHRLLSCEIADSDGGNLDWRFRDPGNAQDRSRGWNLREIVGEDFVQFSVVMHIFKVNLDVNQMILRQARCFERASYIVKRLANLISKGLGSAPVLAARSQTGDIHIVSRIDCGGTAFIMCSRRLWWGDHL